MTWPERSSLSDEEPDLVSFPALLPPSSTFNLHPNLLLGSGPSLNINAPWFYSLNPGSRGLIPKYYLHFLFHLITSNKQRWSYFVYSTHIIPKYMLYVCVCVWAGGWKHHCALSYKFSIRGIFCLWCISHSCLILISPRRLLQRLVSSGFTFCFRPFSLNLSRRLFVVGWYWSQIWTWPFCNEKTFHFPQFSIFWFDKKKKKKRRYRN